MKYDAFFKWLLCAFMLAFAFPLAASTWTAWTEYPGDPIYNPGKAYYPSVIFNSNKFNDNSAFYKMWYEGNNEIGLAYSADGISWTQQATTGLPGIGAHPDVLYDANGFGGGTYTYKKWYWDPTAPLNSISSIQYSASTDGVNWITPISISQDSGSPLVTGVSPGYFYHLYGPGFLIYNASATSTSGQPLTFPYVMYFDTSTEGDGPETSVEQTGLAYSSDGLLWTRYGSQPVIIPSGNINEWDGRYIYQSSVIKVQDTYHMFYSGSNGQPIGSDGNATAHGIGHASSTDGINWILDSDNPIFYISETVPVPWRINRTYNPAVIFDAFCDAGSCNLCFAKMWFTGANSSDIRAIGYATLPCPPMPAPLPPSHFRGVLKKHDTSSSSSSSCRTEYFLHAKWHASPSTDVILYRIYEHNKVVKQIAATSPLIFRTSLHSRHAAKKYSIVSVNSHEIESSHVKLEVIEK